MTTSSPGHRPAAKNKTRTKSLRSGGFRVSPEKIQPMLDAVLAIVPRSKDGILFEELCARVEKKLSPARRALYGYLPWYAKVAQLDLEANGLLVRVSERPLRLRRP